MKNAQILRAHPAQQFNNTAVALQWFPVRIGGIATDRQQNAWNAGRLLSCLPFFGRNALVQTEFGGIWALAANGAARCTGTTVWDPAFTVAMTCWNDGETILATDGKTLARASLNDFPYLYWTTFPSPGAGGVRTVSAFPNTPTIVLIDANGQVFQSTDVYGWQLAAGPPIPGGNISMAEAGASGIFIAAGTQLFKLSGSTFGAVAALGPILARAEQIVIASDGVRQVYALAAGKSTSASGVSGEPISGFAASSDAGATWQLMTQPPDLDLFQTDTAIGGLAVSPSDPKRVAIGWRKGVAISKDGGTTWSAVFTQMPHTHDDVRHLAYNDDGLWISSDGGLCLADIDGKPVSTMYNKNLDNLECLAPYGARQARGSLAVSYQQGGVVAAALQDNGVVVTSGERNGWNSVVGGDGTVAMFLRNGALLFGNNDQDVTGPLAIATFDRANVKIVTDLSSDVNPQNAISLVNQPAPGNEILFAVAAWKTSIFGLKGNLNDPGSLRWVNLVDQDASRANHFFLSPGEVVTAIASADGSSVVLATTSRIMVVDVPSGGITQSINIAAIPGLGVPTPGVVCIAMVSASSFYAALNNSTLQPGGSSPLDVGKLLRIDGGAVRNIVDLNVAVFGMTIDWTTNPKAVYISTASGVKVSRDDGKTVTDEIEGLPANPLCADIQFVEDPDGTSVYLSTFGRSIWRTDPHNLEAIALEATVSVIASRFGSQGNLEIIAPSVKRGLAHYFRDNDRARPMDNLVDDLADFATLTWAKAPGPCVENFDAAAVIESDFGAPGNLEVVARKGGDLLFLFRDGMQWNGPNPIPGAPATRGMPALLQRRSSAPPIHGDFELAVPGATGGIYYMSRQNQVAGLPWTPATMIVGSGGTAYAGAAIVADRAANTLNVFGMDSEGIIREFVGSTVNKTIQWKPVDGVAAGASGDLTDCTAVAACADEFVAPGQIVLAAAQRTGGIAILTRPLGATDPWTRRCIVGEDEAFYDALSVAAPPVAERLIVAAVRDRRCQVFSIDAAFAVFGSKWLPI